MSDSEKAPPPPIVPSLLAGKPDTPISALPVQISPKDYVTKYPAGHFDAIVDTWRLSCYLATAQIFLGTLFLPEFESASTCYNVVRLG